MLEFSREDALAAAEQFLSGLSRFTNYFFDDGAASRLLKISEGHLAPEDWNEGDRFRDAAEWKTFNFYGVVEQLYDFAAYGLAESAEEIECTVFESQPFENLLTQERSFLTDMDGQDLLASRIGSLLVREVMMKLFAAARARVKILQFDLYAGDTLHFEELAALAGVTVKTLRNSASSGGAKSLKTQKVGTSTKVAPEDALEWLRGRPGFRETQLGNTLFVPMESYKTPRQLGLDLKSAIDGANTTVEQLMADLGLSGEVLAAMTRLVSDEQPDDLSVIDPGLLLSIATKLEFEKPREFALEATKIIAWHGIVKAAEQQLSLA